MRGVGRRDAPQPADDIFVRIERELDIDTQGQLIASVLSKKIAAGATHIVIDIPVGPTAKSAARKRPSILHITFRKSPRHLALYCVACLQTAASLSAEVSARRWRRATCWPYCATRRMRRKTYVTAWRWSRARCLSLAVSPKKGRTSVGSRDDQQWPRLGKISENLRGSGGFREPPQALYVEPLLATTSGRAVHIDNRKLSRLAKLAGAPESPAAGIQLQVRLGDEVTRGQSLMFCMRKPLERWPMHSYVHDIGDIVKIEP